jgi:predicted phage tail protein
MEFIKRLVCMPLRLLSWAADVGLRQELEQLRTELKEAKVQLRVQGVEIDAWAAVSARNMKRVEAETAIAVQQIAQAEAGGSR